MIKANTISYNERLNLRLNHVLMDYVCDSLFEHLLWIAVDIAVRAFFKNDEIW